MKTQGFQNAKIELYNKDTPEHNGDLSSHERGDKDQAISAGRFSQSASCKSRHNQLSPKKLFVRSRPVKHAFRFFEVRDMCARKGILIVLAIIICALSVGAERNEPHQNDGTIDFEAAGFHQMSTTAYCVGHHTANGSPVHTGGCASSIDHIGDIAVVYTLGGNFLGYYECNDTGAEGGGVRNGVVLDVYRNNLTQCEMYMRITGGKIWIRWIEGEG